ncbi:hypothetical protein SEPCBS57363_001101 [Sporothrix epigloea]|uniref:Integral membrane protein n=1 Tax=Sporothrix epigloea TaxID=1892477 RepID=A0ABP0DA25_9PEZI
MSGYPYQSGPPQRQLVPSPQQTLQATQPLYYNSIPPPPAGPSVQAPPYPQPPIYQTSPQTPHTYAQQHETHHPQPSYQPQFLAHDGSQPVPTLPPRPPGGAGPFLARTNLSFPPPPRSPNRPPSLPPRPQVLSHPQQTYAQQQPQTYTQQPVYGQPAQPAYAPSPTHTPAYATAPAASPVPTAYQQNYYPSPPPLPPQNVEQTPTPATVEQPVPSPAPVASPAAESPTVHEYATSYNYYEAPAYPTTATVPVAQANSIVQYEAPVNHEVVSSATPASLMPAISTAPANTKDTGDAIQQMGSMLQGMSINTGNIPDNAAAPVGPERDAASSSQPFQSSPPQPYSQSDPPFDPPPASASPRQTEMQTRSEPEYPGPQYSQENYAPHAAEAGDASQPPPALTPASETSRGATYTPHSVDPPFRPVISCIDNPMSFDTWWYTNPSAPTFYICSKCYMDHLFPTQFQNHFEVRYMRDGIKRHCRFSTPRITDSLVPDAVARGSLDGLVAYMQQRVAIPDCKGLDGAKGGQNLKWFRAKHDAIPGLVICEACFQDVACLSPFAYNFESSPPHNNPNDTWACDLAVAFIRKEFEERSKSNDWQNFCSEAKARLEIQACPKNTQVMISLRKWFTPVPGKGPEDAVVCAACYCDRVLHTGQQDFWQQMPRDPIFSKKYSSNCCAGQFNILMAFSAASDTKNWPQFWRSLNRLAFEEKPCLPEGIVDGKWYTLPSQPHGLNICGACHAGIVESLGLQQFFVPVRNRPAPGTAVVCSMNASAPRFVAYVDKLLETWFKQDCASWEKFARRYANIPPCCRETDYKGRAWYGWPECTICAECYLEFVQGTALDTSAMPLRPQILGDARICDMYSPRMRGLYKAACKSPASGLPALLSYSAQRRLIYFQTMPTCRNILLQQKLTVNMANMARLQSVAYTGAGNLLSAASNHHDHTYGQAGVGYGFDNMQQLTGARYNVEADQLSAQVGGGNILLVGQLESKWRSVE